MRNTLAFPSTICQALARSTSAFPPVTSQDTMLADTSQVSKYDRPFPAASGMQCRTMTCTSPPLVSTICTILPTQLCKISMRNDTHPVKATTLGCLCGHSGKQRAGDLLKNWHAPHQADINVDCSMKAMLAIQRMQHRS